MSTKTKTETEVETNIETDTIAENPDLEKVIEKENDLKRFVVNYVGQLLDPEDGKITVEMIVGVFANQFPEFLMAVAEENWIRGYQQAFTDLELSEKEAAASEDNEEPTQDPPKADE